MLTRVAQLNKQAMTQDFFDLKFDDAKKTLLQALALLKKGKMDNEVIAARTHLNLGIIYITGFKDQKKGQDHFFNALTIDNNIELDPAFATPELQTIFDNARDMANIPSKSDGGGDEGDVSSKGLSHKPIEEGRIGQPIAVKAQLAPDLQVARVVLFYRAGERGEFEMVPMTKTRGGYVATIPAEIVDGQVIHYYIEAQGAKGKPVAASANATNPLAIALREGGGEPVDGEEPADGEEGAIERPMSEPKRVSRKVWVSLGIGSGAGLATGNSELANPPRGVAIQTGIAPAWLHVAPEVGYFLGESLALSLQGRFQLITLADAMDPSLGQEAKFAPAVFVRALYFFSREEFRGYASFAVGGGELRHTVDISQGVSPPREGATDTVNAGPIFVGPGIGFHYNLSERFALVMELQALAGFDKFTVHIDGNLGIAFLL